MKKLRSRKKIDPSTIVLVKQILMGLCIISVVAGLLTGVWYGTRANALTINQIQVEGGQTINHEEVRALAQAQLTGEYVAFIPRTFAWLYPHDDIVQSVSQVKRIHSTEVHRVDGKTLLVSFAEFLPDALWCQSITETQCVFLDEAGYGYAQSPVLDGGSLLRFVHTSSEPTVGESLVEQSDYELLNQLATLLEEQEWIISHIEVDAVRDAFLHVVGGGEFKVTLSQAPEVTVENLLIVLTSEEFQGVQPGSFQYIDLRFGNKVFVNEEIATPEEDVASDVSTTTEEAAEAEEEVLAE